MSDEKNNAQPSQLEKLQTAYLAACHAMQTGVKTMESFNPETEVQLRIGLNVAMSSHGALVGLLVEMGVFTEEEIYSKMIEYMQREVARLEGELTESTGGDTKFSLY